MKTRDAVRILLLSPRREVLLMRVLDPRMTHADGQVGGTFWCTVGGGIEPGEDLETAAAREVLEETGRDDLRLGPPVWTAEGPMIIGGETITKKETYFVGWLNSNVVSTDHWTDEEKELVKEIKWWSAGDVARSAERIYPTSIRTHLPDIIAGKFPDEPIDISGR